MSAESTLLMPAVRRHGGSHEGHLPGPDRGGSPGGGPGRHSHNRLRKDFTVDESDVLDARIMGADCVLVQAGR